MNSKNTTTLFTISHELSSISIFITIIIISDASINLAGNVSGGGGLSVTSAVLIRELEQLKYEYAEKVGD